MHDFSTNGGLRTTTKQNHVPLRVQRIAKFAAGFTLLQAALWFGMSLTALLIFHEVIKPTPLGVLDHCENFGWSNEFPYFLSNMYFSPGVDFTNRYPGLDIMQASTMGVWMKIYAAMSIAWFIAAIAILITLYQTPSTLCAWIYIWSILTLVTTVLDITLASIMGKDLAWLLSWEGLPKIECHKEEILATPSLLMTVAARAGIFLILNIVLMFMLARAAFDLRQKLETEALKEMLRYSDPPISAFGDGNWQNTRGETNAAFDMNEERVSTFIGPQEQQKAHEQSQQSPSKGDEDDLAHLSWMRDVDKYVPVYPRRPNSEQTPVRRVEHVLRSAEQVNTRLPRLPLVYIPQPDYTPPAVRSTRLTTR